jgi:ABC-type multidrug transport system ATPase subunit
VDRRATALLPDSPQFDPWLTGREVVALAKHLVAPELADAVIDQVLHDAGLTAAATRRVGGYSRGMLQRLGLAATVVGEPKLLLLDEPAAALDPAGRRDVLDLIAHLRGHATVILSSHLLAASGARVVSLAPQAADLEDVFLEHRGKNGVLLGACPVMRRAAMSNSRLPWARTSLFR